jgi:signal transduction histidine kinase
MNSKSLYGRIALVFALIVLTLGLMLSWLGYRAAKQHQHEVLQRVSLELAKHIAGQTRLVDATGVDAARTDALFQQLMAVNPNVEVYLLDAEGRILRAPPNAGALASDRVALDPVRALLAGAALPVLGEDPQHAGRREIFSAAPILDAGGTTGYVYIVLLNDMYRGMVADALQGYVTRSSLWLAAIAVIMAMGAGLAVFAAITRRLQRVTGEVEAFAHADADEADGSAHAAVPVGDEIDRLSAAFALMRGRLQAQMAELKQQDELRRQLVANVSHDLRTPLTSMQGYLESLVRMGDGLSRQERQQYLEVAVRQSHKVSRLAQQLFELARLECEETLPQPEIFSISELVQDIAQKYALTAQRARIGLHTHVDSESLFVWGDIGLIERVISNLMDNAIRHTPQGGEIRLEARASAAGIEVSVSDTGHGISAEHLPGLLVRGSPLRLMAARRGGGLGLLIASRILSLHGSRIDAASRSGQGTRMGFVLPSRKAA